MKHRTVGGMTTAEVACGATVEHPTDTTRAVDRVTCPDCLEWAGFD